MRPGVIARLRDLVPLRPLTREEALRVAERQAHRFHSLLGLNDPEIPEEAIAGLPRLQVERMTPIPVSGSTHWSAGRWVIVLNGAEPVVRQRFSLAHEFKHILDHRFIDVLYRGVPRQDRLAWIEQVCDFFAGCLLMPRPMVKRIYFSGVNRLPELAARFRVSQQAMQVRLNQIGLVEPATRCRLRPDLALRALRRPGTPARYQRTPVPLVT